MIRNYAQYADKPNTVKWLNILPSQSMILRDVVQRVRTSYDIDKATSYELDVIGRIVGINRTYESVINFQPLMTFGDDSSFGSGSSFSPTGNVITQEVSDAVYRKLLKAKIAKNNTDATIRGVIETVQFITGATNVQVVDNQNMTFNIQINDTIDDISIFVLDTFDIVPRGQGVMFLGYDYTPNNTRFGDGSTFNDGSSFGQFFGV
jgi:hypothetical protein